MTTMKAPSGALARAIAACGAALALAGSLAPLQARTIGFYSKGCLAGAVALPINGPTWQVMRLSRNRNWGHPKLIEFLERLAAQEPKTGWRGVLVGDMSQPAGGPTAT